MNRVPHVRVALLAALLCLTFGIAGSAGASSSGNGIDPALAKQLRDEARGSVTISEKKATKSAGFISAGANGDLRPSDKSGSPSGKANGFLKKYGALLGATGESQLVQKSARSDGLGGTQIRYEQVYNGVPVWGGQLVARLDASNNLTAVAGVAVPNLSLSTSPRLTASQAGTKAIEAVVADPPANEETGVKAQLSQVTLKADAKLYVYKLGLVKGDDGAVQLVYQVEVTDGSNVRDFVFVSAFTGKVVNRYSAINDALFRRLYEQNTSNQVWQEGQAFPGGLNVDQQNIVTFSGHSYYHFFNAFARDSYDALGAELRSVNNDPTISCPNANWNGSTTNYCNGVTSDDVVAHEWGHAYTEYTHNLIYQWQPGALNESYSDIWGETVDLLNGVGTDTPGGVRTVGACSTHTRGIPVLVINTPTPGTCAAGAAAFGPPLTAAGTTGDLVLGLDPANAAGPSTTDACSPLTNAAAVNGNIALVDRGTCGFVVKVKNAQNAGARGVVVANTLGRGAFGMGGADATITIPSLGISNAHGDLLKGYLVAGSSNVTLKVTGSALPPEDSYRWLMGEDATAFGGAIRDMWTPTCLGDPGKVSDAEYHCDPSDGGGVHSNSGVPNHGYSLLVDGGTYNSQTVTGLGLVKAAHLYWRAQSVYQIPTTDFEDHANALEASCTDLISVPLEGLSMTSTPAGPSGQSISAADCVEVTDMIAAVELRTEPTQCNFQPALKQNPTSLCANQKNPPVHYEEDFEDGLAGWTLTNTGVFAGWPGTNWAHATSLPGGRAGSAAFGENLQQGNCDGGAGDVSGVMRLQSPSIQLPGAAILSPRLTFEHYFATELGWDGGNVKISVNGGAFVVVPASAFDFNPYNGTINPAAAGNTNPLAGEPGFTGTDGGEVTGSWGESQIDLSKVEVGVKAGDTIQLRFDFGMDGCTGIDGWYVDDVKVSACNLLKKNPSVTVKQD